MSQKYSMKTNFAIIKTDFDIAMSKTKIIPQDLGRVIMNELTNGLYAV
jgi:hypothetical protein